MEPQPEQNLRFFTTPAFGVILGLALAGIILLLTTTPQPQPIQILATPTPVPMQTYITGEVVSPGVYELPQDSRVADLLNLAGGFTQNANETAINLAAYIHDGQSIVIPSKKDSANQANEASSGSLSTNTIQPININYCTQGELENLPGIGEKIAKQIIIYRESNGDFLTIEAIMDVPGIGEGIFESIKQLITVK